MRRALLVVVMLTFLLVVPAGMAMADRETDTVSLAFGDEVVVELDLEGTTRIKYDIQVESGPNVNVWFLEFGDYNDYDQGRDFLYYFAYSSEDVSSASKDFTWTDDGLHYIIIDTKGTANPDTVVTVTYTVEWEQGGLGTFLYTAVCVTVVVVGIIGFSFMRSARKRKLEEGRSPPMAPHDPLNYYGEHPMPPRRKMPPSDMGPGYIPPDSGYEDVDRTRRGGPP